MTTTKLKLLDVTICAADSVFVDLTARALSVSINQVEFGDAILFSDSPRQGPFRNVKIEPLNSITAYSRFCLRKLADFIETPYALVVQWDGYVVNANAWARAFQKYDYIGAAWHGLFPPEIMVGNGGFSLRSRKLLKAVAKLPVDPDHWEDRAICQIHRSTLERNSGIRFAPVKVADRFSYEYKIPETPPFGFHGVYHLWRHVGEPELLEMVKAIDVAKTNPHHITRLVVNCAENGYEDSARALYRSIRKKYPQAAVRKVLTDLFAPAEAESNLALLEHWI